MQLTASDIYAHYRPSRCALRVYLTEKGVTASEPSPYAQVLKRLGHRHEQAHLETFLNIEDLSRVEDATGHLDRTKKSVNAGASVIYQPRLKAAVRLAGLQCEVSGVPDFLIKDNLGYRIRDSKISRRITQKDHPEIILQMQIYAWLFERCFQIPATNLEVHSGDGSIIEIPYAGPDPVIDALREIVLIRGLKVQPFSPVGMSKCGDCGFHDNCWQKAEEGRAVALVGGIDQGLAVTLNEMGVLTMDQFLEKFDAETLAELKRPKGTKLVRVGNSATTILRNATALASGEETVISKPNIPQSKNYVMFDLEGLPPQFDELQKVYLWGMQVFGEAPGDYTACTAGFGINGDREAWEDFLSKATSIFDTYGDVPFVHWHTYEATLIKVYLNRFGDDSGRAARVQRNLLDLLPITERSIVLPLPSYSLKVVEKYVGFERTQPESNGNWSMAKYIEATETEDEVMRAEVMDAIRTYNREDLEATWAVLQWLLKKTREGHQNVV